MDPHSRKDFTDRIRALNKEFKADTLGVSIVQRGNRLYIRATLPPKPWTGKTRNHQQDISLGVYANPAGLKKSEKEARKVAEELAAGTFDWESYPGRRSPDHKTFGGLIEKFKKHFFGFGKSKNKEARWEVIYRILKHFPAKEPFSAAKLEEEALKIIQSKPSQASKQTAKVVLKQFINFLKKVGAQ